MKATETSLTGFMEQPKTQFIIPVYQRNYDWTLVQCKQLLDDILRSGDDDKIHSHFIGSIVYIHDDVYSTSRIKELSIIDGQQRLTTVTLLWIVIYSLANELNKDELKNEIYETYLINKFVKDDEKLKLRPTENNDKALKHLVKNDENDTYDDYSRLIENYYYFKTKINEQNIDVVMKGINKLLFVEISLDREKDLPQRIFESLNSTGLELSQADLIRNLLLMGLKYKDQLHIYDNFWKHIEKLAYDEESNKSKVSDFIRDFLTIEKRDIPNKNKVYNEFKKKYSLFNLDSLKKVLGKMKKYVRYYNVLINPKNEKDREIRNQIKLINKLEISVAYPFLLEVYNDYSNNVIDKNDFIEVLELIQSFCWRRFIVGLPTNALNKIFMRLYEDIDSNDYLTSTQKCLVKKQGGQRFPKDSEVISTLKDKDVYGIQSRNRTYFFERLENFENREPVMIENNPDITIDHIFPQNPNPKWKLDLGNKEYNLIKDEYLNTIANLTLSGNNGSLGNKSFEEKRDLKGKGYKESRLFLNKYLASIDRWDEKAIEKRFSILAKRFLKIWKYPKLEIDIEGINEEINIFDADDPTHKKLEYAIFFDQKMNVKTVSKLYKEVITFLFEEQPETFFSTDLSDKMELTKNKNDLRKGLPISETYFIESNLDSKGKFERLEYALIKFQITDELYIKYQ